MPEIWFPNLDIEIMKLDRVAFELFGKEVYWYGILMALAFLAGLTLAIKLVKQSNVTSKNPINPDLYYDAFAYILIISFICARLYYVIFEFDRYKGDILSMFAIWNGGIAIYGGIIGGVIAVAIFTKKHNLDLLDFGEPIMPGLALGQAIGRWGNFINREAYGRYTDNLFAMRILREDAQVITDELAKMQVIIGDYIYIQVHPTFLYESVLNLINCIVLIFVYKHRKFKGQVIATYMIIYGITRTITEGLRVDQLQFANGFAVSRLLSMGLVIIGIAVYIHKFKEIKRTENIEVD